MSAPAALVAVATPRIWPQLPDDLVDKIISFLGPNEVPHFRLVNKAAASRFCGPEHITLHLSQPVPPHAFAAHWLAPGATRGLTLARRLQLLSLTAASGMAANLELVVRAAGCLPTYEVLEAAAASGQLGSCQWLHEHGCPTCKRGAKESGLLAAAAGGGHRHVCEWLLGLGLDHTWGSDGAAEAARGGHVGLAEWLLDLAERRPQLGVPDQGQRPREDAEGLAVGAAHGCDLPTLVRLWRDHPVPECAKGRALAAAAGSPTPDWAAKVEWLEAQGCQRGVGAASAAASCPDDATAAARLAWLRSRGYPLDDSAVLAAVRADNAAALQYLLEEACMRPGDSATTAVQAAVREGRLGALRALHDAGWMPGGACFSLAVRAAVHSHLGVLAWLVETPGGTVAAAAGTGAGAELWTALLGAGARSGSVELMASLVARGGELGPRVFSKAASSGCEEAVEWLVERGCPVEGGGWSYTAAAGNGDLAMAALLRRLGAPWGPDGRVASHAARAAPAPMLRWLLAEGCPARGSPKEAASQRAGTGARGFGSRPG
ncbi:hypothetical protein GPECTOR_13g649 [Gonium pectorale]|uniref:F-box domain-containing protein n=1 Tax=Gonium pectorale TaxID=33097 RepID=A0A150GN56_GONPE|nr:hypothetical protein GPECTOR_13g649 [Gonium pectorale]|eukprot:KXZ51162.1 hypothetical protein GPECTOR_13g649 [Gonium pectorale]